jgi:hypothetical protein
MPVRPASFQERSGARPLGSGLAVPGDAPGRGGLDRERQPKGCLSEITRCQITTRDRPHARSPMNERERNDSAR